jgi:hypothetical protein
VFTGELVICDYYENVSRGLFGSRVYAAYIIAVTLVPLQYIKALAGRERVFHGFGSEPPTPIDYENVFDIFGTVAVGEPRVIDCSPLIGTC